jgi:hypothetical protein
MQSEEGPARSSSLAGLVPWKFLGLDRKPKTPRTLEKRGRRLNGPVQALCLTPPTASGALHPAQSYAALHHLGSGDL